MQQQWVQVLVVVEPPVRATRDKSDSFVAHQRPFVARRLFSPVSSLACSQSDGPVDDIATRLTPALPTAVERGGRVRRLIKFCVMC